jgi:dTDP-glucose 4,6-dehydratase
MPSSKCRSTSAPSRSGTLLDVNLFRPKRLLVTGGAGFIGSTLVSRALSRLSPERLVVLDALTYAGHRVNLDESASDPRFELVHGNVCDRPLVERLFAEHAFDAVLHLAAESHVDRSIEAAETFVRTNVLGTQVMLDVAERHFRESPENARFVHVSTDEVYGSLGPTGTFDETSPYAPSSPYSASKASADLLALAAFKTHGLPVVVTHGCNTYGPRQLPEKLVPLTIERATRDEAIPVYGAGDQVRQWLHVDDHADAILSALERGRPGRSYAFGSRDELSNLALVTRIADLIDELARRPPESTRRRVTFVTDRKGHDFRYALDSSRAERELLYAPARRLAEALPATIAWYVEHEAWRAAIRNEEHERFQAAHSSRHAAASAVPSDPLAVPET